MRWDMKNIKFLVAILVVISFLAGYGTCKYGGLVKSSTTSEKSGEMNSSSVSKTREKKFFSEIPTMETPDSLIPGLILKEKEDKGYIYSLSESEEVAQGINVILQAYLQSEGYTVTQMSDHSAFSVEKDGKNVAIYMIAHVDKEYILAWTFFK